MNLCLRVLALSCVTWLLAGCEPDTIRVYRTPKDFGNKPLRWKTPTDWTEADGDGMRVANFRIAGKDGKHAEVTAIPLPGMREDDLAFVNLWRQQMQLPAATEADLSKMVERISVGELGAKLYDVVAGEPSAQSQTNRIIVAAVAQGGLTWFIKLQGDALVVVEQKPTFLAFLKSVRIHPNAQQLLTARTRDAKTSAAPDDAGEAELPDWQVPEKWQQQRAPQFAVAAFVIPGTDGAGAEVSVSHMGGNAGGTLMNVNRWRGQMKLEPVSEADLAQLAKPLDVAGGKALFVELSGTYAKSGKPSVMLAALVSSTGSTWVYKLVGDTATVTQARTDFLKFIQTAKHPNG